MSPQRRRLLAVVALAVLLAGCTVNPEDTVQGTDGSLVIEYREVDGHGTCAFAIFDGHHSGGVALVGCR